MADGTNVGKINLQIDLTQDLQGQISNVSNQIAAGLQEGIQKGFSLDGLFNGLQTQATTFFDSLNTSLDALQAKMKAITGMTSGTTNATTPEGAVTPMGTPTAEPTYTAPQMRIPTFPKITPTKDLNVIQAQIDEVSASFETVNQMIDQQKAKLAMLQEQYTYTFNAARQNDVQGQMLATEQRINSLTATSDKLNFTLSDLDDKFEELSNGESDAGDSAEGTADKMNDVGKNATIAGDKFAGAMNRASNSTSLIGNVLDRMLLRMVIFQLVIKQIENFTNFVGKALMTNQQFAASLNQIKSNLETAFMPIYNACLPAINALMKALATVTGYIAAFISALFGTSVKASAAGAGGLNKAINAQKALESQTKKTGKAVKKTTDALKGSLASFDEINQLQTTTPKEPSDSGAGSGGGAGSSSGLPNIVTPKIDTSAMKGIEAAAAAFKKVLATLFDPMKAAWKAEGPAVMAEARAAFKATEDTVKHFFDVLASPPVQKFLTAVDELVLALVKLALKIYDSFILPIVNWFISLLPGAAKGLTPIVQAVTNFVNYLSGPGFGGMQVFLSAVLGVLGAIATFKIITQVIGWVVGWVGNLTRGVQGLWAIVAANPIVAIIALIAGLVLGFIALYNTNEKFRKKVNEVWATISQYLNPILRTLGKILLDLWHIVIEPLAKILTDVLGEAFNIVIAVVKDLWNDVLVPLGKFLAGVFAGVIKTVGDIWKAWEPIIKVIMTVVMALWNTVLKPILSFLVGAFITGVNTLFRTIKTVISDLAPIFNGLLKFIDGVFTGNWKKAWEGVKEIFKGIWKAIQDIGRGALDALIDAMNSLIGGLNKLDIHVPKIAGITDGFNIGFHIPKIPRLATGGIIDQPTLAMMGEQNKKEAVVPLENTGFVEAIRDAVAKGVATALIPLKDSNRSNSNSPIEVTLQIDGTKFGKVSIKNINKVQRQAGKTLITV